ncbi:hypothetical protein LCGC14_0532590 [marine sediment metagenome]|uniref:Uncharacterized protein n=1 Tax=marine sediment metagenome TaxID=412755 RepID=A0A0F9RVD5_9ZZZZ
MSKTITIQEARETLVAVIRRSPDSVNIDYERFLKAQKSLQAGNGAYLEFESSLWGGSATVILYESFSKPTFSVEVSWFAMRHTVAATHVAIETYQQALRLAALLEATIQGFPEIVEEES